MIGKRGWRVMLGRWLLKPVLLDELEMAIGRHQRAAPYAGASERYWMGRATAVRRILNGSEEEHR
jgi:hypothetical protein